MPISKSLMLLKIEHHRAAAGWRTCDELSDADKAKVLPHCQSLLASGHQLALAQSKEPFTLDLIHSLTRPIHEHPIGLRVARQASFKEMYMQCNFF